MKKFLIAGALVSALGLFGAGCARPAPSPAEHISSSPADMIGAGQPLLPQASMSVKGIPLTVEVARTADEKARGLSGRRGLAEGTGMLFVFDAPSLLSFWMPDMQFDLDIIWIRDDAIVDISARVPHPNPGTPLSQLPAYSPRAPVAYVLEVPAGWVEQHGAAAGDKVILPAVDRGQIIR